MSTQAYGVPRGVCEGPTLSLQGKKQDSERRKMVKRDSTSLGTSATERYDSYWRIETLGNKSFKMDQHI